MTEQDQMHAHILGKLSALEATLLVMLTGAPDRSLIKSAVALYLEASTTHSLFDAVSDAEIEIFRAARERTFRAILP